MSNRSENRKETDHEYYMSKRNEIIERQKAYYREHKDELKKKRYEKFIREYKAKLS